MNRRRHPITEQDAAAQAEALIKCPRFLQDVGIEAPESPESDALPDVIKPSRRGFWDSNALPPIVFGLLAILAGLLFGAGPSDSPKREPTLDDLWRAICAVESGNNPDAPDGDGGKAVGVAQIWPCVVEDVNEYLGRDDLFTLEDRRSARRSRIMFDVYVRRYAAGRSNEWIARAWNSGPGWERKPADVMRRSAEYWRKVRKEL